MRHRKVNEIAPLALAACRSHIRDMALSDEARKSGRSVTVDGNRLSFYADGPERLDALIGLIDNAQRSVRMLYYIFLPGKAAERIKAALCKAIGRGVKVSLLIDGFGSSATPEEYFADLVDAGIRFCRFNPSYGRRYLLRNHQKMTLVDGETDRSAVMIGGFNIADDYFPSSLDSGWRDVGLLVEGPAAARLTAYYDKLMNWAKSRNSHMRRLRRMIFEHSESHGRLQWQLGGPTGDLSPWGISTARDLVQSCDAEMIVAYFAPPWSFLKRTARTGRRGRGRLIAAGKSDNTATIAAARFTYGRLLKRGVEIFEYLPAKLHTKLMILDDVAHIGSSNLDIRSLFLNMELMLRVEDGAFAQMMRTYFEGELVRCCPITPELHKRRSTLLNRIRWAVSFFLVTSFDYGVTRRLNFNLAGD
ncbi:MAG TPA: phosphatidylserine/phosphatidylglycerophosphate/cardiolipin synthase family protein [Sphingomicrobium sp.]|nr:phosphatidylserine/phosphatidylglycerophosphate/cardiolipin synthase family protein [Sphingomicrobium sp.]